MIRYFAFAMMILCSVAVSGQKSEFRPPDYKKINKKISATDSPENYQRLMDRFRLHDTTLSRSDYHLLYYGYSLQPGYAPYAHEIYADSLMLILRDKQLKPEQYDQIIRYADAVFEKSPFDMRFLDPLIYVYQMKGDRDMVAKLELKLGRIIETIFNTGDGLTEKTAFHVVSISHEYDILRALGFGFAGEQILTRNQCDLLKVDTNDYGITGIYFNVSALMNLRK